MFKTRECKIIDEDKLVGVFVGDVGKGEKYYLDILGGKVLSRKDIKKFYEKRYKLIEPFETGDIENVMKDFIDNCGILVMGDEDEVLAKKLIGIRNEEGVLEKATEILKGNDAWTLGCTEWRDTHLCEDIKYFIL